MDKVRGTCIVLGEASESDDEEYRPSSQAAFDKKFEGAVIAGEASESDYDSDDVYHITAEAFASKKGATKQDSKTPSVKYNSLLHKKLRESNWKLKEKLKEYIYGRFGYARDQVNEVNQELLSTQVLLHETATVLRRSNIYAQKLNVAFTSLTLESKLPDIHIEVPTS